MYSTKQRHELEQDLCDNWKWYMDDKLERNYQQTCVERKVCFSVNEIYEQAYSTGIEQSLSGNGGRHSFNEINVDLINSVISNSSTNCNFSNNLSSTLSSFRNPARTKGFSSIDSCRLPVTSVDISNGVECSKQENINVHVIPRDSLKTLMNDVLSVHHLQSDGYLPHPPRSAIPRKISQRLSSKKKRPPSDVKGSILSECSGVGKHFNDINDQFTNNFVTMTNTFEKSSGSKTIGLENTEEIDLTYMNFENVYSDNTYAMNASARLNSALESVKMHHGSDLLHNSVVSCNKESDELDGKMKSESSNTNPMVSNFQLYRRKKLLGADIRFCERYKDLRQSLRDHSEYTSNVKDSAVNSFIDSNFSGDFDKIYTLNKTNCNNYISSHQREYHAKESGDDHCIVHENGPENTFPCQRNTHHSTTSERPKEPFRHYNCKNGCGVYDGVRPSKYNSDPNYIHFDSRINLEGFVNESNPGGFYERKYSYKFATVFPEQAFERIRDDFTDLSQKQLIDDNIQNNTKLDKSDVILDNVLDSYSTTCQPKESNISKNEIFDICNEINDPVARNYLKGRYINDCFVKYPVNSRPYSANSRYKVMFDNEKPKKRGKGVIRKKAMAFTVRKHRNGQEDACSIFDLARASTKKQYLASDDEYFDLLKPKKRQSWFQRIEDLDNEIISSSESEHDRKEDVQSSSKALRDSCVKDVRTENIQNCMTISEDQPLITLHSKRSLENNKENCDIKTNENYPTLEDTTSARNTSVTIAHSTERINIKHTPAELSVAHISEVKKQHFQTFCDRVKSELQWWHLPDEVLLLVFSYLPLCDLIHVALTCRRWHRVSQDCSLWQIIEVSDRSVSDDNLEAIAQHTSSQLSLIRCLGNNVTNAGLRKLFRHISETLTRLNITGCRGGALHGDSILLQASVRCYHITHLHAGWSGLSSNGVLAISDSSRRLETLSINGCHGLCDSDVEKIVIKHGKSLRIFELSGCFNITNKGVELIASYCQSLTCVNLGQCHQVTDDAFAHLFSSLDRIQLIDLHGCNQIERAIEALATGCTSLTDIVLANCPLIGNATLSSLTSLAGTLQYLDVNGCVKITDEGMCRLAKLTHKLSFVDISSTSCQTKTVQSLANYCALTLEVVKLSYISSIRPDAVVKLVKHCKRLHILHMYGCKNLRNLTADLTLINSNLTIEI